MKRILDAKFRSWVYDVSIAVFAFLTIMGVVNGEWYAAFTILAGAITGMARANTTDAGAGNDNLE